MTLVVRLALSAALWAGVALASPTSAPTTENDATCAGGIDVLRSTAAVTAAEEAVLAKGNLSCLVGEPNPLKVEGNCPLAYADNTATQEAFGDLVKECVIEADGAVWAFQTSITCVDDGETRDVFVYDKFYCVPMMVGCLDDFESLLEETECEGSGDAELFCGDLESVSECSVTQKAPELPVEPIDSSIGDTSTDSEEVCLTLLNQIRNDGALQAAELALASVSTHGCLDRNGNGVLEVKSLPECPFLYENPQAVTDYESACNAAGGEVWMSTVDFSCDGAEHSLGPRRECVPAAPGCLPFVEAFNNERLCESDPNEISLAFCSGTGLAPTDPRFDTCASSTLSATLSPVAAPVSGPPSAAPTFTSFDTRPVSGGSSTAAVGTPAIIGIAIGALLLCCILLAFFLYKNREEDDDDSIEGSVGSGKRRRNVRDPSIILRDPHFIVPPSSRSPRKRSSAASSRRSSRDSSRSSISTFGGFGGAAPRHTDMQPEEPMGAEPAAQRGSLPSVASSRGSYRDEHVDFMRIASGQLHLSGDQQEHDDAVDL